MAKKSAQQIKNYYQKEHVVEGYNDRRFSGIGGDYINSFEIKLIVDSIADISHPDSVVLDIGAGRGRLTQPLSGVYSHLYALEKSKEMIRYLKKTVPNDHILEQSIFEPVKTKQRFNIIASLRFFEHFDRNDQLKILKHMNALQMRGDYLIYATVNHYSFEGIVANFFPYGRYNYFLNTEETQALFDKAGYRAISVRRHFIFARGIFLHLNPPFLTKALVAIDTWLSRHLSSFGSYQVYTLKKV